MIRETIWHFSTQNVVTIAYDENIIYSKTDKQIQSVYMSFYAACSAWQNETVVDYNTMSDVNSCNHHKLSRLSTRRSPG